MGKKLLLIMITKEIHFFELKKHMKTNSDDVIKVLPLLLSSGSGSWVQPGVDFKPDITVTVC